MRSASLLPLLLFAPCIASAQQQDGLLAHYTFTGDANNSHGPARHGIALGAELVADRFGQEGNAYSFDENAAIYLGTSFTSLTLPFTVSGWIHHEGPVRRIANIMSSSEAGEAYTGFWLQVHDTGQLELSYGDGGPRSVNSRRTKMSDTRVPTDQWAHVAAVLRGPSDMSLYIDGEEAGGWYSGYGNGFASGSAAGFLGLGDESVRENSWHGTMDDIRVYKRALLSEEIQAIFASEGGAVVSEPDPQSKSTDPTLVFPNPMGTTGTIRVDLERAQYLRVDLYDVVGRRVQTLHDGWLGEGESSLPISIEDMAPGTYILRALGDEHKSSRHIVIR
jgi:hypothetical protein